MRRMVISAAILSLTASVTEDFPMPGPAMRKTAWLARLRIMLQTCSIASRRPVSCLCVGFRFRAAIRRVQADHPWKSRRVS